MTEGYSITIDTGALAAALQMPEDIVIECFRDGRVASRFAEHWAATMFGVRLYRNKNHPSSDGYYMLPDRGVIEVSIRTLTARGIKFQDSKYIGIGRSCTMADLKASIRRTDQWRIIDVANFPLVAGYKVKCSTLEHMIDDGELTTAGITYQRFAALLNRYEMPMMRQLQFP